MKSVLRLFLVLSLVVPTMASAAPQRPPQDCVICGHVCCCPEMCAPRIAEMKAREAESVLHPCDRTIDCGISSASETVATLLEKHLDASPLPRIVNASLSPDESESGLLIERRLTKPRSLQPLPPTPPPRRAA